MSTIAPAPERSVPALGGFNLTFLGIEFRRRMRNRRTLVFTLVLPVALFLLVGMPYRDQPLTATPIAQGGQSVAAYILISMAVYGAMVASTSAGGAVAVERATGWSRQLRLTPLNPVAYIAIKVLSALVLGLISVLATFAAGLAVGVRMSLAVWILSGLTAWLGSLVFTALGLFIGYLVPSENVMQFLGPILAVLALFGGLFTPLNQFPELVQDIARWTPVYGLGEIARAPLTGEAFDGFAVLNILAWLVIFSVGAALVFRRDTKRV
ncbi:ABC transporter permease [Galbitalea sp. SE-J8]|uniref:ABC transporter permease n=1 Tax=Galbitalea sp. SE-J8 TaxID=3054952 RepID=UPI00259CD098|nr:ABC transporter permease [Galbitalea sp. SE-J8]MDM4762619.1 ABC transporter permease [Galbitalea sp. SE-J8]